MTYKHMKHRIDVYEDQSVALVKDNPANRIELVKKGVGKPKEHAQIDEKDAKVLGSEDMKQIRFNRKSKKIEKWQDDNGKIANRSGKGIS